MRSPLCLAIAGLVAACGPQASTPELDRSRDPAAVPAGRAVPSREVRRSEAAVPAPGQPGGLADDRSPVSEAPFTKTSAQGAADVVQTYYALLEEHDYAAARRLWRTGGEGSGPTAQAFAESFRDFREYHAQVGKPGEIEGAAGSLFVSVPVQIHGVDVSGKSFSRLATVTLRRVNGVPGASADQLRWHIDQVSATSPGDAAARTGVD
jgi:hypothetical protein